MFDLIEILLDDFEKRFLDCEASIDPLSAIYFMELQNEFMDTVVNLFEGCSQPMSQGEDLLKEILSVHNISDRIANGSEFSKKIEYLDNAGVDTSSVNTPQRTLIDYCNIISCISNFDAVVNSGNNSFFENAVVYQQGARALKFKFREYNYGTGKAFSLPLICGDNISIFPRSPIHSPR